MFDLSTVCICTCTCKYLHLRLVFSFASSCFDTYMYYDRNLSNSNACAIAGQYYRKITSTDNYIRADKRYQAIQSGTPLWKDSMPMRDIISLFVFPSIS